MGQYKCAPKFMIEHTYESEDGRDGISLTEYQRWDVPHRYMIKGEK